MKPLNAMIERAKSDIEKTDAERDTVVISMKLVFQNDDESVIWNHYLKSTLEIEQSLKLLKYAGAKGFDELDGKCLRIVQKDKEILAFGHPTKDRFINLKSDECKEMSFSKLMRKLKPYIMPPCEDVPE